MIPPPPWLPQREFDACIRVLTLGAFGMLVCLAVGFGLWLFYILPAMFRG